jgi:sugar transferase (PEP-CTERM system associated)
VIRIFNLYVPTRTLVLLAGEIAVICASFALAVVLRFRDQSFAVLNDRHAFWKILAVVVLALLCLHYMELYDLRRLTRPRETLSSVFIFIGTLSFLLSGLTYLFPQLLFGRSVFLTGLCILALTWILWRWAYERLIFLPIMRERVYLIGQGERAKRIAEAIRTRGELGMDVVGWAGEAGEANLTRNSLGRILVDMGRKRVVDRVIVALSDRRSTMPVEELLDLRMQGVRIEDGTAVLEKVSGQIEVDGLHPSWLIFGDGFRLTHRHRFLRPILSTFVALMLSILTLPFIPIVVILIKLGSPGPILYRQKRVGLRGRVFNCYKFRTMRPDAEADSGPTWASDEDPRVTKVGKFLRGTRLDEIPQLWNVLRGDMQFVGPRPERPEFVAWLTREIPYYELRHTVPPGITGWAQVYYKYGNTLEHAKEKLKYDLYYIKNRSFGLDTMILFQTIKTVLLRRGSQ